MPNPNDTPWFSYIATLAMTVVVICGINAAIDSKWLRPEAQITNTSYQSGYEAGCSDGYKQGFTEALYFRSMMSEDDRQYIIEALGVK